MKLVTDRIIAQFEAGRLPPGSEKWPLEQREARRHAEREVDHFRLSEKLDEGTHDHMMGTRGVLQATSDSSHSETTIAFAGSPDSQGSLAKYVSLSPGSTNELTLFSPSSVDHLYLNSSEVAAGFHYDKTDPEGSYAWRFAPVVE